MTQHCIYFSTDITQEKTNDFAKFITEIQRKDAQKLTMAFNSIGGNVNAGIMMHNLIRSLPNKVEVEVHNIGTVGSIAIPIFLAADVRKANPFSSFVFHGSGHTTNGVTMEARKIKDLLATTEENNKMISGMICDRTNLEEATVSDLIGGEVTKNATWAEENGLVSEVSEFQTPSDVVLQHFL